MTRASFQKGVFDYYKKHKRNFPWRRTQNPYHILVSEIMLQQTQVARVIPKYKLFLKKFSTVKHLARASQKDVLRMWLGLGYNRRALYLHKAAKIIVNEHGGVVPNTIEELIRLPGVGKNTAGAILAFAFNKPVVFIETNIRSVFLHHFFKNKKNISDEAVLKLIRKTLPEKNIREWYSTLMDYGVYLKNSVGNPNIKSKHYIRQGEFKGSDREVRGVIMKAIVLERKPEEVRIKLGIKSKRFGKILLKLRREGLI